MPKKIEKILIANRGEIAIRVIRTARDLGIKSVAIYSDLDRDAPFVNLADEAYALGEGSFRDTYMNPDKVLKIAIDSGSEAIHPGYGFLSENSDFARSVVNNSIAWLGPSGDAIEALGDKVKARKVAQNANVDPVPGLSDFIEGPDVVRNFIKKHGYPVILKRADGGGGQGISIVKTQGELENFFLAHTHDIGAYFIERFVEHARHVETQCARDIHGNFSVVSTRDCSVQRRNQKLLEEAPAAFLLPGIKEQLFKWSKSLFETVGYEGLGTCEYLLETKDSPKGSEQSIYFLEVNPRLQVEHTVSEEVTGVDLVAEQISIAEGSKLSPKLLDNEGMPLPEGHSFELRITSEDPFENMTPTGGTISHLQWPMGPGIRLEPGIVLGDEVSTDFDSMVAKIIISASSRDQVIRRTKRALRELEITGISTPKVLFSKILDSEKFNASNGKYEVYTKWLENEVLPELIAQGSLDQAQNTDETKSEPVKLKEFVIEVNGKRMQLRLPEQIVSSAPATSNFTSNQSTQAAPRISSLLRKGRKDSAEDVIEAKDGQIVSPMQAIVVRSVVEEGQKVNEGDLLIVLEAMKMEKFINAPESGIIEKIHIGAGDSVDTGTVLVSLKQE